MNQLSTKDMTEYLKQVALMEGNVYKQERSINTAKRSLKKINPEKDFIEEPVKVVINKPDYTHVNILSIPIFCWVCLITGIYIVFTSILRYYNDVPTDYSWTTPIAVIFLLIGIIPIILNIINNSKDKEEYLKNLELYPSKVKEAEKKYFAQLSEYKKQQAAADKKYKEELAVINKNYSLAEDAILQMKEPYDNAKQILKQLYDLDIIFPKYRNMVAMCTIYEYFASGRCSELTGPTGAYNLYESELRQNLIISKLDTVINTLEDIKQNQFILYSEIKNTNNILSGIGKDISDILENTNKIVKNTHITAVCSQVAAQNTATLKYISLVNK